MFFSRTLRGRARRPQPPKAAQFAALLSLCLLFAASASARELQIRKFSAKIFVEQDASLNVTETIQANFIGEWHGLYRTIPVVYVTPQGFDYSLYVNLLSATDASGRQLKVESSRERHYLKWKIYVDNAIDAERTIVLNYRVKNGLKFFEDHDELYWNITGDEWDVPIQDAGAQIFLPEGVTGVRATDFTGAYQSRAQNASTHISGNVVDVTMNEPLGFHEGLTVAVAWNKGAIQEPGAGDSISLFLSSNWPVFFPVFVFIFMFWLWLTRGRDPRTGPVAVQYAPPEGLTPAEAGALVDDNAGMRDVTATIVDLAVRGYLTIEEKDSSHMMGLVHNKDYVFHLKKATREWAGLKGHELVLLSALFSNGVMTDVPLSSLQNRFYKDLPGITNSVLDELMERGYFQHRPDYVRGAFVGGGIVLAALMFFLGFAVAQRMGMAPMPFVIAGILSGAIIVAFGWFMPARTVKGARALAGVLGFEDFLTHVESDRMARVSQTPETFEKFLPFAMALGVEKKWVGAFQNIYTQPPSWYQGGFYNGNFNSMVFASNLNAMTAHTATMLASAPRSSGGSGFGGGGSSGGGFGGGGGGGF